MVYKDKRVSWQESPSFISNEFEVFMLSKLVFEDVEIRFDEVSAGNSDHSWYALPASEWIDLEAKYGQEFVESYFSSMPALFDSAPVLNFELLESNIGSVFL